MSESAVIVCKPTSWIKIRAVLIIAMFGVFAYLFYTDGTVGYKEQNEQVFFNKLITIDAEKAVGDFSSGAEWKQFAEAQKINVSSQELYPLPEGFNENQSWPAVLVDGYASLSRGSNGPQELWASYAGQRGWPIKPPEHGHDQSDLNTQYYMCYGCATIVVVVLFLFLRTLTRTMRVTESAFIAPGGKVVPFTAMRRIDARKWDTKGVATISYEDAGITKKTKVDGMIYGQFKKEDGEPAEKLYAHILKNFKGELIEFEKIDDADEDELESGASEPQKNSVEAVNS